MWFMVVAVWSLVVNNYSVLYKQGGSTSPRGNKYVTDMIACYTSNGRASYNSFPGLDFSLNIQAVVNIY